MLFRLFCAFVLVPLLELALLIRIGTVVGAWPTLALVVGTGLLGAALARREGTRTLLALQRDLAEGRLPAQSLVAGASVLVGGAFLLTPGVLTDLAGLCLLLPLTRRFAFRWVRRRMEAGLATGAVRFTVWGMEGRGGSAREEGGRPPRPGEIIQD
ncbi:MAG: FxsA family protein [Gammaproteobacteria bacterium]|nr:FxsA family protein [Gammaproteobacteria bacterium]